MTVVMTLAPDAYLVLVLAQAWLPRDDCVATSSMSLLTLVNPPLYSSLLSLVSSDLTPSYCDIQQTLEMECSGKGK